MCFVKSKAFPVLLFTDLVNVKYPAVQIDPFRSFIRVAVLTEYIIGQELVGPHHIPHDSLHFLLRDDSCRDPVLIFTPGNNNKTKNDK